MGTVVALAGAHRIAVVVGVAQAVTVLGVGHQSAAALVPVEVV